MSAKLSFVVAPDGTIWVEFEITGERLAIVTVAAAGIVSVFYLFREPILNALRHPQFPHDYPVIDDIENGSLIVKLRFLTPSSFLRFYDDYKSGKLKKSLAEEIVKLTTKPTTETATTMTVFDESLPVKFKESLEEKFKNLRFDDKLTVKIRDEEKVKTHVEKLRANTAESQQGRVPCIIIHGGTHGRPVSSGGEKHEAGVKKGIIQAAERGYEILKQGGSAVDAVEKAVCVMEDNPSFNAGHGAMPNIKGGIELDAMIMDGSIMKTGAVMSVSCISNPVSLAKRVMEDTVHCALNNEGAMDFAKEINFPTIDSGELRTTTYQKGNQQDKFDVVTGVFEGLSVPVSGEDVQDEGHDSVGAVAMDKNGNCACATSTGGLGPRRTGRISDAPLVGCGGYANEFGASSAGGHGESIIKMTLAREVIYNLERGLSAQESAEKAIDRLEERTPGGVGAVIVIDKKGNFGKACNTDAMIWATKKGDELKYGFRI